MAKSDLDRLEKAADAVEKDEPAAETTLAVLLDSKCGRQEVFIRA